ncbi:hypothetical protein PV11_05553 [Exophiala sideris]|uniref:Uncharacterized protein n=1 Tax=Exophiala sideris TaxID=1016849 RepID=A0A0D1Z9X7_9EURO|nr:hypothetical protein PV11_05553 [Exophiala sideris]
MFSEHDTHLEVVRIALRIQDAHDEYEEAHSMQGSDREINSALYAATNKLAKLLHQMNRIQPENPGLARMLEDFGHAEKGTFMGHGDDWDGGECMRRNHRYAHHHPPESDHGYEEYDDGQGDWNADGYDDGTLGNGEYEGGDGAGQDNGGEGYDYSNGYEGEGNGEGYYASETEGHRGIGEAQYDQGYGQGYDQGHGQDQYQPDQGYYSHHDNTYG